MSDDTNIPRVHVTMKTPEALGAKLVKIDPRLLLIGRYSGSRATDFQQSRPVPLKASNFDEVIQAMEVEVSDEAADVLSGEADRKLAFHVRLQGKPNTWPAQVVEQVAALRKLRDAREGFLMMKERLMFDSDRQFEQRLREFLGLPAKELLKLTNQASA